MRAALVADGVWMIVEPYAGDRVEENLNPVGRAYIRRLDAALHALFAGAGFGHFRRATQTPFNLVYEARP